MSRLFLTFYGDDLTGSTDAMEQLTTAGIRTALFFEPPTRGQLARFKNLGAVGVAGRTRSLAPAAMARELRPALVALRALGARHVHYKICSTFDSSPALGNLGCVMDVAADIFRAPFVPLLVAAPALGRYTVFGNHFARYGIGSTGSIHRLDRHPSISRHPVTPMGEADLRRHLSRQTKKTLALFDILKVALPLKEAQRALKQLLAEKPGVVLFDALTDAHLACIGHLLEGLARSGRPLFSIGSSGIETALTASRSAGGTGTHVQVKRGSSKIPGPGRAAILLAGSGSCSPVTGGQIAWALKNGFAEVPLDTAALATPGTRGAEIMRATRVAAKLLQAGRSVVVHTTRRGADQRIAASLKKQTARILGTALGSVLRGALEQSQAGRLCIAGGDTSSFAARALGMEALEMIAPLTPGAPLCRAFAPGSPADGLEVVFKGGQVGAENYFGMMRDGNNRRNRAPVRRPL